MHVRRVQIYSENQYKTMFVIFLLLQIPEILIILKKTDMRNIGICEV